MLTLRVVWRPIADENDRRLARLRSGSRRCKRDPRYDEPANRAYQQAQRQGALGCISAAIPNQHHDTSLRGGLVLSERPVNSRTCSVIAFSVGRRSIDVAPKKPFTAGHFRKTISTSSGEEIGPPW